MDRSRVAIYNIIMWMLNRCCQPSFFVMRIIYGGGIMQFLYLIRFGLSSFDFWCRLNVLSFEVVKVLLYFGLKKVGEYKKKVSQMRPTMTTHNYESTCKCGATTKGLTELFSCRTKGNRWRESSQFNQPATRTKPYIHPKKYSNTFILYSFIYRTIEKSFIFQLCLLS